MREEIDDLMAIATHLREALSQCDERRFKIMEKLQATMDRVKAIREQELQSDTPFVVS